MLSYASKPSGPPYSNVAYAQQQHSLPLKPLPNVLVPPHNIPLVYTYQQSFRRRPLSSIDQYKTNLDGHHSQSPDYHLYLQRYLKQRELQTEMQQQRRMKDLQSMRKHRSLDGSLFLREFDLQQQQLQFPTSVPPPSNVYGDSYADPTFASYGLLTTPNPYNVKYGLDARGNPYPTQARLSPNNYPMGYDELSATVGSMPTASQHAKMPHSFAGDDVETLRRENVALNQKLNYMMNSIKTFWSPELKSERQKRKDESIRLTNFQDKIMQQANEIQQIRNELKRREKDIGQLLSDSDLIDMEDELRCLRQQLANEQFSNALSSNLQKPRDYTDKSLTAPEVHTLKMKMERSEIALAEKQRELQNSELRLKGAEEQNSELEKRLDIVSRSNAANESQLKLIQDDVNMLRSKLETRNQLVESKDKSIKILEKDVDLLRQQLHESGQGIHNQDHRNAQLQIRVDQLETLLQEREVELQRLKQRLLQQPSIRVEQELQQRIEDLETENRKLGESVDSVRTTSEAEKQQQLQAFQEETHQLTSAIERLQKELQDRHVLLASQNEKISQFDNQLKSDASPMQLTDTATALTTSRTTGTQFTSGMSSGSSTLEKTAKKIEQISAEVLQKELEETRNEVGHLLQRIRTLESEKTSLQNKFSSCSYDQTNSNYTDAKPDLVSARKTECSALKMRIDELEEALRESVGITAEREKQLNEQKTIIQQLSNQVSELYKDPARRLKGTGKTDAEQKAWDEERQRYQRQLVNLRKEVTMAAIREKDSCIQLLQSPPDSTKEKIEILLRQKEQLRHRLLTQNNEIYSIGEGGPYLANVWLAAQQPEPSSIYSPQQHILPGSKLPSYNRVQPSYSNYVHHSGFTQNGIIPGASTNQVTIAIPNYNVVPSAPASFTFGTKIDSADEGIWA